MNKNEDGEVGWIWMFVFLLCHKTVEEGEKWPSGYYKNDANQIIEERSNEIMQGLGKESSSFAKKFQTGFVVQYNFQLKEKNSSMDGPRGRPLSEEVISNAVENIFKKYDENHNNFIDFSQFRKMIEDLNLSPKLRVSLREITSIFKMLDVNGDGMVSREEFIEALCEIKDSLM